MNYCAFENYRSTVYIGIRKFFFLETARELYVNKQNIHLQNIYWINSVRNFCVLEGQERVVSYHE